MAQNSCEAESNLDLDLVQRLTRLVEHKGNLSAEKLKGVLEDFPKTARKRTLNELRESGDGTSRLVAVIVAIADGEQDAPVSFVCCDALENFFALSVGSTTLADVASTAVPAKTILHIREPTLQQICRTSADGLQLSYPSVHVLDPDNVSVAGGGPLCVPVSTNREETAISVSVVPNAGVFKECEKPAQSEGYYTQLPADHDSMSLEVKGRVIRALLPGLDKLVIERLGQKASGRIERVHRMFERTGRGQVYERYSEEEGQFYSTGYIENLEPTTPFHDTSLLPWCKELQRHWVEIRDELRRAETEPLWTPADNEGATAYYGPNNEFGESWRISGVLVGDNWVNDKRWPRTRAIIEQLPDSRTFEVFFARMPPHSVLNAHSDNLNYQLTLHLALDCEYGKCAFRVGNQETLWKEGEMLIANTSYVHSCRNDSDRSRYVLVVRFWHPGLTEEELLALKLASFILEKATSDPSKKQEAKPTPFEHRGEAVIVT